MTTYLLIRHALTDVAGRVITGRNPGVHLNEPGMQEAERLAHSLGDAGIAALYSSPLERARETARAIANRTGVPVRICDSLTEVDYGAWSGSAVDDLKPVPQWRRFNLLRSTTAPPAGELMLEIQTRMVRLLENLRVEFPNQTLALVSHGDVIRGTLAHYLGIPVDLCNRLEISPASISTVVLKEESITVLGVNQRAP